MTPDPTAPTGRIDIARQLGIDPSMDLTDVEHDAECLAESNREREFEAMKHAIEDRK